LKTFKHDFVTLPKMERVLDEQSGNRVYVTPSGNRYMSVTTLTGKVNAKEIQEWRQRIGEEQANKISKRAATRGTSMHKLCEKYLLNEIQSDPLGRMLLEDNNPLNVSMFKKIMPLVERLDNIKLVEGTMYSDELELAGTSDCIAEYNGDLAVIDFKTSTRMKKKEGVSNYWMQGAAYGKMYEDLYGVAPKKIILMISVETADFAQIMIEPYEKCLGMLIDFKKTI
jgi:genome maintenance exonuclease 1